ncbi:MAG: exo-alpha-sialidase [Elusimicrobia bacterium]|nr:exo-alpha-sialidase [Elusimicrobiota bacterium]
MAKIRVLVGTKKGGFILTSDGKRKNWKVQGPLFTNWEVYHMAGSPADPNRLYASQTSGWFGQVIQRSSDGGKTWETPGGGPTVQDGMPKGEANKFVYEGKVGQHLWYDGSSRNWEFKRVWHLEPSHDDPDVCYAGVEDAALFKTSDGARTWKELPGLRQHATASKWNPGAGGMCLHTILLDGKNPKRLIVAISAAGVFRSDDSGKTWKPANKGLTSDYIPDKNAEVGYCVHKLAQHPSNPDTIFMQLHGGVLRTDDAGGLWKPIAKGLPNDFGFPIAVHAHDPETLYVIPIDPMQGRVPPEGKLRVFRSKDGGKNWKGMTKGLPQENCFVNVLRDAMAVDTMEECGVYFGTTGGQVYVSADGGDSWDAIVQHLPHVLSVEVQTIK